MTQNEMVLGYLKTGQSITPLEALDRFGIMRLGARIHELKRDGYAIIDRMEKNDRTGKTYKRYWLASS